MAQIVAITVVKGKGLVADSGILPNASAKSVSFNSKYINNLQVWTVNGGTGASFDYSDPAYGQVLNYLSNQTVATITTAINT